MAKWQKLEFYTHRDLFRKKYNNNPKHRIIQERLTFTDSKISVNIIVQLQSSSKYQESFNLPRIPQTVITTTPTFQPISPNPSSNLSPKTPKSNSQFPNLTSPIANPKTSPLSKTPPSPEIIPYNATSPSKKWKKIFHDDSPSTQNHKNKNRT